MSKKNRGQIKRSLLARNILLNFRDQTLIIFIFLFTNQCAPCLLEWKQKHFVHSYWRYYYLSFYLLSLPSFYSVFYFLQKVIGYAW